MIALLLQITPGPDLCATLGSCAPAEVTNGASPGWMFLAVGLIAIGWQGLRRKA